MNFKDYQKKSRKMAIYDRSGNNALYYVTLGLVGEAGEIAEKMKKIIRDKGNKLDQETKDLLTKELGDVLWYMAQLCTELGLSFDEVAKLNLKKLLSRQKRGKVHGDGDNR